MRFLLLVSVLFYPLFLKSQCALVEVPLDQRIDSSSSIIEGRVIGKESYWDLNKHKILSSTYIEVFKEFKNGSGTETIEIVTQGGVVGDRMMLVSGGLNLQPGDVGVFFLTPATERYALGPEKRKQVFEIYALPQGFIKYYPEEKKAADPFAVYKEIEKDLFQKISPSGDFKVIKDIDVFTPEKESVLKFIPVINSFSPQEISAGTGSRLTIRGSGFNFNRGNSVVRFPNADDGGAGFISTLPAHYISWTDNEIVVEVPSNAGSGRFRVEVGPHTAVSPSNLEVIYARTNVMDDNIPYVQHLIGRSPSGGYVLQMNQNFSANVPASEAFTRAFNNWRCHTGVNWFLGQATEVDTVKSDGINIVRFDHGAELVAGTLGICISYYSGCRPGIWYLDEFDLVFDDGTNWQFGPEIPLSNQADFETIALHELGHGHQLGHVIDPADLMHYSYTRGRHNRLLNERNLAAAQVLMDDSTIPVCGRDPMVPLSDEICEMAELNNFEFTGLSLFPNPATTELKLGYRLSKARSDIQISLFNSLGQRLYYSSIPNQPLGIYSDEIDLVSLGVRNGLYFLRFQRDKERLTYKVVVK